MDALDREILGVLRTDARISYRDLGIRVGLSANAAADRVRRLVRDGTVAGFTVIVDPAAENGTGLTVFIDLTLRQGVTNDAFEQAVVGLPGIEEAVHITGAYDYLVRARVSNPAELDALLRTIKRETGAERTSTRIALRSATRGRHI